MAAATLNLTGDLRIEQGSTYDLTLTIYDVYDVVTPANNVLHNLTGHTARMQIRKTLASNTVEQELLSSTAGAVPGSVAKLVLGGAAGTIRIFIPAAITAAYNGSWTMGVYDLEIERTSDVYTWREIKGDVELDLEVTR